MGDISSCAPISVQAEARLEVHRELRPILIKVRSIKGLMGLAMSIIGPRIAKNAPPEKFGHFGLQIGDRAYELHCDNDNQKGLLDYKLSGEQIWKSDINEASVGYCYLTDGEIDAVIAQIVMTMRSRGRYHVFRNNCHMFIQDLWRQTREPNIESMPHPTGQSNVCPAWFIAGDDQIKDDESTDNMLMWMDALEPLLSLLLTIFSPNNFSYVMYGLLFWCVGLIADFLRLDGIAGISDTIRNICVGIIFIRCAYLYTRKYFAPFRNVLKNPRQYMNFGIGFDHDWTRKLGSSWYRCAEFAKITEFDNVTARR